MVVDRAALRCYRTWMRFRYDAAETEERILGKLAWARRAMIYATAFVLATVLVIYVWGQAWLQLENPATDTGDKLSFYGAMLGSAIGAALAIFGALLVGDYRRAAAREADKATLRYTLRHFRVGMKLIEAECVTEDAPEEFRQTMKERATALLDEVLVASDIIELAVSSAGLTSFRELAALHRVRRALARHKPLLEAESRTVAENPPTVDVLEIYCSKTNPSAQAMIAVLDDAITALGG